MKHIPKSIFTPWGWSYDLVKALWGEDVKETDKFQKYCEKVKKDINYQCVIFAEYDWGILAVDCCDDSNWEVPIYENHIYIKMQYNPEHKYLNNVFPFTYLPKDIPNFNKELDSWRKKYISTEKTLTIWHRYIAVSLERFRLTEKIRQLGYNEGGQFCIVPRGKGYEPHEDMGLLDPIKSREIMPWEEYFSWCCKSKSIVDARGFGEFTHRMSECFGIGIPLIRPKITNQTYEPLIAGIHYLDCGENGNDLEKCIEKIQDESIRQDLIKNGIEWYERNCTIKAIRNLIDKIIDECLENNEFNIDYQKALYSNYKEKINPSFDINDFSIINFSEQITSLGGENNDLLYELIDKNNAEIIIEIGTYLGSSCISMADYLKKNDKNGIIISIDTWLGSIEHHQTISRMFGHPDLYHQFLANIILRNVHDRIIPLPQTSSNAIKILKNNFIEADLIYIDASHEEDDVYNDIKGCWSLLKTNGVIFGHDWNDFLEVNKAVEKFALENNIEFTTRNNYWIMQK